jgi:hypothetical protein
MMRKFLTFLIAAIFALQLYPVVAFYQSRDSNYNVAIASSGAFSPSSLSPAWWQEARNFSTFFQSNAGSGAAPAVNGDVIGYIPDLSGNSVTLASNANDATRPTLAGVGTFPAITCTATNSTAVLNTTGINSYNAGSASWFFAVEGNINGAGTFVAGEGNGSTTNTIYSLSGSSSTASSLAGDIRNSAGTVILANSTALETGVFNSGNHVIGIIDNGTTVTPYLDGVAGTPFTYTTRTGTLTTNRFAICANWRTAINGPWTGNIYGGVIVNRVLNSTEIGNLNTYLTGLY